MITYPILSLAVPFLIGFSHDWMIVCGMFKKSKSISSVAVRIINRWLPVAIRILIAILFFVPYSQSSSLDFESGSPFVIENLVTGIFVLLLVFGFASRVTAIGALLMLGIRQMYIPLKAYEVILILMYVAIIYSGSGALSLWKPEDKLIFHRAGGRNRKDLKMERAG